MKMYGQSRSFVKQVQLDLLALCDADLFDTIQQWLDGDPSQGALDVPEETHLALGYTSVLPEARPLENHHAEAPGVERERSAQWHAPSPQQLRSLLSAMDARAFAQHVITFAYTSLHPTHPEWHDGWTFNAHLANYLRRMRAETATSDQRAT
jgi:hypothetical protein